MKDFAAIDFETANPYRSSVCSVGIVVVREGIVRNTFYRLIRPEPNYYMSWNTRVHGLTAADTDGAPRFPDVWRDVIPLIEGLPLVAHNSPLMRVAFGRPSNAMRYPTQTISFTAPAALRAARFRICPITV